MEKSWSSRARGIQHDAEWCIEIWNWEREIWQCFVLWLIDKMGIARGG
jgi:hypothetical protein